MSRFLKISVYAAAALTFGILIFIIGYILYMGLPALDADMFSAVYTAENASVLPAAANTAVITVCALLAAGILGIFGAVYISEYTRRGSRAVRIIRLGAETLAAVPSIVYGLFGMLFFVIYLGWGYSLLAGAATLALMVLPLILRTSEEALRGVPAAYRDAAMGLGAGRLRTVFAVTLPSAVPGILSGIILAAGRIVGETAALIYTAGSVAQMPVSLMSSGRTLAVHMYALSGEGLYTDKAYATAVILLIFVLFINLSAAYAAERVKK